MPDAAFSNVTVSIVGHGQSDLVSVLLGDLARCDSVFEVILTQNIPEGETVCPESLLPHVRLIRNNQTKGFAANHNQTFRQCKTLLFAVFNPDIRLEGDPFSPLAQALAANNVGLVVPVSGLPQSRQI